jgi:hypothetical protein
MEGNYRGLIPTFVWKNWKKQRKTLKQDSHSVLPEIRTGNLPNKNQTRYRLNQLSRLIMCFELPSIRHQVYYE